MLLRVVRFVVEDEAINKAMDRNPYLADKLGDIDWSMCHVKGEGTFLLSPPMVTSSAQFFIVEGYMRAAFGDPSHLVEDLTEGYKLLRTRAPQAYDYGYCIEIAKMQGEFGEERLVVLPKEHVAYQSGRYSSGMYTPIDCS